MQIGTIVTAAETIEGEHPENCAPFVVEFAQRGRVVDAFEGRFLVAFEGAPAAVEVEADQVVAFLALA